jgi:hypothetical protein
LEGFQKVANTEKRIEFLGHMLKSEGGQIKLVKTHQCLRFSTGDKIGCCNCNNRLGVSPLVQVSSTIKERCCNTEEHWKIKTRYEEVAHAFHTAHGHHLMLRCTRLKCIAHFSGYNEKNKNEQTSQ